VASDVRGAFSADKFRLVYAESAGGRRGSPRWRSAEAGDGLTGARGRSWAEGEAGGARLRRRYLARHPEAAIYADFGDFAFWRLKPEVIHAVAGFGRIETLSAAEVFPPATEMEALEESAIAHMNEDHADAVRRYATKLLGAADGDWRIAAIDPDGADLSDGRQSLRLAFPEPVYGAEALRPAFMALSDAMLG
jgi:putative heme iron utilization protein